MTFEEAKQVADTFRVQNPGALSVRIEKRTGGEYRAVYDHYVTAGRQGATKKVRVSKPLIASWKAQVSPHLWNMLADRAELFGKKLSEEEADELRRELEPQLPKRWHFPSKWFEDGFVYVVCGGKKKLVTSHCDESKLTI